MKIARVFPKRNNFTPTDPDAYFDEPNWFTPLYEEVHISVVFSWDKPWAEKMVSKWDSRGKVKIGGPAYGSPCDSFIPGRYVRPGVIFTTRGCPNKCWFCHVPKKEGDFRELDIVPGNIIQDNNIMACSDKHWSQLCAMLKTQHTIEFKGGIEARRLTDKRIDDLRGLKVSGLWLACDKPRDLPETLKAIEKLHAAGFTWSHIKVYTMCGLDMEEEQSRMEQIYLRGGVPFAQLF